MRPIPVRSIRNTGHHRLSKIDPFHNSSMYFCIGENNIIKNYPVPGQPYFPYKKKGQSLKFSPSIVPSWAASMKSFGIHNGSMMWWLKSFQILSTNEHEKKRCSADSTSLLHSTHPRGPWNPPCMRESHVRILLLHTN